MHQRSQRLRSALLFVFLLLCLSVGSMTFAGEAPSGEETTAEPHLIETIEPPLQTPPPTEPPAATETASPLATEPPEASSPVTGTTEPPADPTTELPPATEPTDDSAGEPATEPTDDGAGEPAIEATDNGDEPADESDVPEVETTPEAETFGMIQPLAMQTSCTMDISDAGDNDPFTFQFNAVAHNIESFEWDFGDSTTANTQAASHTYVAPGDYTITLKCTPVAGFGDDPLVLTGSITITPVLFADFDLVQGNVFTALPQTVSTNNQSSGGTLTYEWKISASSDPSAPGIYTATTENISYTFTSADITSYPATFYFHLKVSNGSQTRLVTKSVIFNILPPKADFSLSPVAGTAPLTVTVEGIPAAGSGPIDVWSWDFGDGSGTATGSGPHTYTYAIEGTYWIILNYSGPGGSGTVEQQVGVYPDSAQVEAGFTYALRGEVAGGYEVCFTNTSTGPFTTSEWDFDGDGTYDLTSNAAVVCHVYPATGNFTVRLRVSNADASSEASKVTTLPAKAGSFPEHARRNRPRYALAAPSGPS